MNPHPPLSAFPFVTLTLALCFELLAILFRENQERAALLRTVSWCVLLSCIVFAPITYLSGYWGVDFAKDVAETHITTHQTFGKLFLLSLIPTMVLGQLRRSAFQSRWIVVLYFLCFSISYTLVGYGSWLGGEIVFVHGGGVQSF